MKSDQSHSTPAVQIKAVPITIQPFQPGAKKKRNTKPPPPAMVRQSAKRRLIVLRTVPL
jgi:hypothetical protein